MDVGYVWTVDMDLEKFFDTVNQSKLMEESWSSIIVTAMDQKKIARITTAA